MKYLQLILWGLGSLFLAADASSVADEKFLHADNYFTKCIWGFGTFPNPWDCSKYFKCAFYVPYPKSCPEKQLFHTEKRECRPEKQVDCGNRPRPGHITTLRPTEPIVTEVPKTSTTEEEIIESTTVTTINEITSTTKLRPTGPSHNCDEDDVDCIITETGNVRDWFVCPRDIGSFAHPSSDRLFIFCMNWIPSVRKCGQGLVYSSEHFTCIDKE